MLQDQRVYAVIPTKNLAEAQAFYEGTLGLQNPVKVPGGVMYECGGGSLLNVYETNNAGTAQNTAMGWSVDDLAATMADLRAKGIVFEEYDYPDLKTVDGVADMGGHKAAWFKDPDGNYLCISQMA